MQKFIRRYNFFPKIAAVRKKFGCFALISVPSVGELPQFLPPEFQWLVRLKNRRSDLLHVDHQENRHADVYRQHGKRNAEENYRARCHRNKSSCCHS